MDIRRLKLSAILLGPILFTFVLNIGFIFDVPNQVEVLNPLIEYISAPVEFNSLTNLLVGVTTAIAVFFGFAPIALSIKTMPIHIIRKYLLKHDTTYLFFALQFSVGLVIAFFSSGGTINRINIYWCFLLFFISFAISILYFYWLSNSLSTDRIVKTIFQKINPQNLIPKEEAYTKKREELEETIDNIDDMVYGFQPDQLWNLYREPNIYMEETKTGFLDDIDIQRINDLLDPIKHHISTIEFRANIGDILPKADLLNNVQEDTPYILYAINFIGQDAKENSIEHIHQIEEELKDAVTIVENSDYKLIHQKLNHILDIYEYSINTESNDFKVILEALNDYISERHDESEPWNSSISYEEDLLKYTVDNLIERSRKELTEEHLDALFVLAYSLMNLAIKKRSLSLITSLFELIDTTLYKAISSREVHTPKLFSFILNIKELVFRCGINSYKENQNHDDFEADIQTFYNPLIYQGLNTAIRNFAYLVEHYEIRHEVKSEKYLLKNAQYLIDFLNPIFHWRPGEFRDWKRDLSKYLSKYLLYISILIFKKSQEGDLPRKLIKKLSLPYAEYCNNFYKDRVPIENLLNDFFYSPHFYQPTGRPETFWFEDPIHESGSYSPSYYNFDLYWIALSIYRKYINKSFIPSRDADIQIRLEEMNNLFEHLSEEEVLDILSFLNASDAEKLEIYSDYREHIASLIEE